MVEIRTHPLSFGAPTPAEELPTANTPRAAAKHPYLKVRFLAIFSDLIFRRFQSEEITEESPEMAILKILDEFLAKIKSNGTRLTMKELEVTSKNFKDLKKILLEKIEEIERDNIGRRGGYSKKIALTAICVFIFVLYVSACLYLDNLAKRWSVLAVMINNAIITIITLWWR